MRVRASFYSLFDTLRVKSIFHNEQCLITLDHRLHTLYHHLRFHDESSKSAAKEAYDEHEGF
jgi:hypothetical protein